MTSVFTRPFLEDIVGLLRVELHLASFVLTQFIARSPAVQDQEPFRHLLSSGMIIRKPCDFVQRLHQDCDVWLELIDRSVLQLECIHDCDEEFRGLDTEGTLPLTLCFLPVTPAGVTRAPEPGWDPHPETVHGSTAGRQSVLPHEALQIGQTIITVSSRITQGLELSDEGSTGIGVSGSCTNTSDVSRLEMIQCDDDTEEICTPLMEDPILGRKKRRGGEEEGEREEKNG